ncbi:hypothetical protein H6G41_19350 [Tolypothrix sp. FACHB-123]|uniref:hypothetical protein n=1 Tax=Tolypothrix sp. FACHB-123 TaxID=2692868 RepID=UPI0016827EAA|nr:hypothetical protein [Tolypothrix sp. FACHB-123]MBD2356755.1 hypothetical protein [Tolypothrix sp. FACHB-123]
MKNLIALNLIPTAGTKPSYQIKIVALIFLATMIPVTLIFLFLNIGQKTGISYLTRDPSALTHTPFYIGLFSNIGILLWCAGATSCLFSYAILKKNHRYRELSKFLLFSGFLTCFLMFDDLLLLHEEVFPKYLNISENVFYVFYLAIILFGTFKNFNFIKKTELIILLAAVVFFVLSIVSDRIYNSHLVAKIEDLWKLVGISTWFTYLTRLCLREISSLIHSSATHEDF